MVHYGLNKTELVFDAHYKIVILILLRPTYLLSGLGFKLNLENVAGLELTHACKRYI